MTTSAPGKEGTTLSYARHLDESDALAAYRSKFYLPQKENGEPKIYLNGNSLGLQPRSARHYVERIMEEWEQQAVKGHFEGKNPWIPYHERLAAPMAKIVGAKRLEVVIMNTLTVNLHLMLVSFYRPESRRHKILMESDAFPSDRFAVESQLKFHGYDPEQAIVYISPPKGQDLIRIEDLEALLANRGEEIALILLGIPNYYTGQVLDIRQITELGHRYGCRVGFNLAHGAGNIPLQLHDDGPDFAVWCTYKYLNGGPGNLSGCFIHERYADDRSVPRFAGWWGQNHATRFNMRTGFDPMRGADGWCVSNAPILPLAALEASLNIFDEVGMEALIAKSRSLTGYLESLLRQIGNEDIRIITPEGPTQRGCQLSIQVNNSDKRLYQFLTGQNIITDWREPNVIRAAPVPLYNTYSEVFHFAEQLRDYLNG